MIQGAQKMATKATRSGVNKKVILCESSLKVVELFKENFS